MAEKIDPTLVDLYMADIDYRLSAQMNEILHHPDFQALERAWLGLLFLVQRTPARQNIVIQFINVSREDLANDFADAIDVLNSGLYQHIYVNQYGQFGGEPVGAILGNYEFGPRPDDLRLLTKIASVAAMAHAPFLCSADKSFFNITSWQELPDISDLHYVFEMPQFAQWQGFRDIGDARYVGITLPRFILRPPYGSEAATVASFRFVEDVGEPELFCWGNPVFAFATRLVDSFARFRWCVNIVGPEYGAIRDMVDCSYETMDGIQKKIPTEVLVSERREFELAEEGFAALTMLKGVDSAAFFSANSCQRALAEREDEDREYVLSYNLSRQLPYMFLITRLAHYIKVIQREYIGSWKGVQELEREINAWLAQYVTTMSDPDEETRAKRPFNYARVAVEEVAAEVGWYRVVLKLRPHIRYMGMNFTISLAGKLDT